MREANEDLKAVSLRPEWHAPVMAQFLAVEAEANAVTHIPDRTVPSTS